MTKLRNIVGVAFVAMSLLTGFAINTAHADGSLDQDTIVLSDRDDQLILDRAERETIEQR